MNFWNCDFELWWCAISTSTRHICREDLSWVNANRMTDLRWLLWEALPAMLFSLRHQVALNKKMTAIRSRVFLLQFCPEGKRDWCDVHLLLCQQFWTLLLFMLPRSLCQCYHLTKATGLTKVILSIDPLFWDPPRYYWGNKWSGNRNTPLLLSITPG